MTSEANARYKGLTETELPTVKGFKALLALVPESKELKYAYSSLVN